MDLAQAKQRIRALQREIHSDAVVAITWAIRKTKADARQLSSGRLSLAELRRRDHPHAKRHGPLGNVGGMFQGNPAFVNKHRGEFYDAWKTDEPKVNVGTISAKLVNDSDVADWIQFGTTTMAPRTITTVLTERAEFYGEQEVNRAVKALETKYS